MGQAAGRVARGQGDKGRMQSLSGSRSAHAPLRVVDTRATRRLSGSGSGMAASLGIMGEGGGQRGVVARLAPGCHNGDAHNFEALFARGASLSTEQTSPNALQLQWLHRVTRVLGSKGRTRWLIISS